MGRIRAGLLLLAIAVAPFSASAVDACSIAFDSPKAIFGNTTVEALANEIITQAQRERISVQAVLQSVTMQTRIRQLSRENPNFMLALKAALQKPQRIVEPEEPIRPAPKKVMQKLKVRSQTPYRLVEDMTAAVPRMPNEILELPNGLLMAGRGTDMDVLRFDENSQRYLQISSTSANKDQYLQHFQLLPDGRVAMEMNGHLLFAKIGGEASDASSVSLNGYSVSHLRVLSNGDVALVSSAKKIRYFRADQNGRLNALSGEWEAMPGHLLAMAPLASGGFVASFFMGKIRRWSQNSQMTGYSLGNAISSSHTMGVTALLELKSGWLLSASNDGSVKSYKPTTDGGFEEVDSLDLHSGHIYKIAELPDGRIVVPTVAGTVYVLKVSESGMLDSNENFAHGHEDLSMGLAVLRNGDFITWDVSFIDRSKIKKVRRWRSDVIEREVEIQTEDE